MTTKGAGARVRGECKDGHVTERMAPAGRITWSGECSEEGCELPVKCKRIPGAAAKEIKESEPDTGSRVTKVSGYARSKRARVQHRGLKKGTDGGDAPNPETVGTTISEPGFQPVPKPRSTGDGESGTWGFFPGIH